MSMESSPPFKGGSCRLATTESIYEIWLKGKALLQDVRGTGFDSRRRGGR